MTTAAIVALASLAIEQGPAVYKMVTNIISGIQREFTSQEEQVKALNELLLLLTPMQKEV